LLKTKKYEPNQVKSIFEYAKKNMKLAFCFPGNTWGIEFCNTWDAIQALCAANGFPYRVVRHYEADIYRVRNKCLMGDWKGSEKQPIFGGADVTHTLWIDSDTILPPSGFLTMLTNYELDIVTGFVKTREDEGYAVYVTDNYDPVAQRYIPWKGEPDPENGYPFQVEHTGLACTLVKKEVYDAVGYPWFRLMEGAVQVGPGEWRREPYTEDTGFLTRAKEKGFRVWADPRVHCGHIKPRMLQ
jgi:hypothetical protein